MAVPHVSGAFGDVLDVDFQDIFNDFDVSMTFTISP